MEALAALGLAGNILTFVDFTTKLLKTTLDVYEGTQDALYDIRSDETESTNNKRPRPLAGRNLLEAQAKGLIFVSNKIAAPGKKRRAQACQLSEELVNVNIQHLIGHSKVLSHCSQHSQQPDDYVTTVENVAEACERVAQQMIHRLEEMRESAKGKVWASVKLALRDLWKESEIRSMKETLEMHQSQLTLLAVASLREGFDLLSNRQADQFDALETSMRDTLKELMHKGMAYGSNPPGTPAVLAQWAPESLARLEEQHERTRREIMQSIDQALDERDLNRLDFSGLSRPDVVSNAAHDLSHELFSQERELLFTLRFETMEDRVDSVSDVKASFNWIFEDPKPEDLPWNNFSGWLPGCDHSLYWITGKAGSGKSTLMKHLYLEPRTRQELHKWAGPDPLVLAGFFFWRTGTDMQKTEEGLLRSLLYQVLSLHRELFPIVFPNNNRRQGQSSSEIWTLSRLRAVLDRLIKQRIVSLKICFFIDGLDEYFGDHMKIARLVKDIANVENVKICASSRPLPDFEHSFQQLPSLMLQNLTHNDIKAYVTTKFNEDPHVAQLKKSEMDLTSRLSLEIVDRASGVFLWVKLAVESILKGLRNEDNILELEKRLRELPDDLMDLYAHMLKDVEIGYQEQGAKFLQTVYHARKPFPILELAFVDVLLNGPDDEATLRKLDKEQRQEKCRIMEKRLKSRCLGLLEVVPAFSETYSGNTSRPVQFMHQSVAEFMEKEIARKHMEQSLSLHPFSPYPTLMKASVLAMNYLDTDLLPIREPVGYLADAWYSSAWSKISAFMTYAAIEESTHHQPQIQLVEDMDQEAARLAKLCLQLEKRPKLPPSLHWSERRPKRVDEAQIDASLISFALEYGLHRYVMAKLTSGTSYNQGRKLTTRQVKFALMTERESIRSQSVPPELRASVKNELGKASRFRIKDFSLRFRNREPESEPISAVSNLQRFKGQTTLRQDDGIGGRPGCVDGSSDLAAFPELGRKEVRNNRDQTTT